MVTNSALSNIFFKNLSEKLKPLNSANDLVDLGIVGSSKTLANKRSSGEGPDFVKIRGTGIRYTRESVLDWLKRDSLFIRQTTR